MAHTWPPTPAYRVIAVKTHGGEEARILIREDRGRFRIELEPVPTREVILTEAQMQALSDELVGVLKRSSRAVRRRDA